MQNWHLGCPKSTNTEPWHTAHIIRQYAARINIQYLQILVEHGVHTIKQECTYIGHANSKRKFCSKLIIYSAYVLYILCIC